MLRRSSPARRTRIDNPYFIEIIFHFDELEKPLVGFFFELRPNPGEEISHG